MSCELKGSSLCGCLMDASIEEIPRFLRFPEVDMIEWRLDAFIQRHSLKETLDALPLLASSPRVPVLATNRPKREGGAFEGPEELRFEVLKRAVEAGAEWVDLEDDTPAHVLESFRWEGTGIVLSHHDFSGTPDRLSLQRLAESMAQKGKDIIKIVTFARTPEDNLRVLELIPFGRRELGVEVIAFCMGEPGRWSRYICLALGSPWTYVQLPGHSAGAPGQFTAAGMRAILAAGDLLVAEPHGAGATG